MGSGLSSIKPTFTSYQSQQSGKGKGSQQEVKAEFTYNKRNYEVIFQCAEGEFDPNKLTKAARRLADLADKSNLAKDFAGNKHPSNSIKLSIREDSKTGDAEVVEKIVVGGHQTSRRSEKIESTPGYTSATIMNTGDAVPERIDSPVKHHTSLGSRIQNLFAKKPRNVDKY